ncbi:hypothetical protein SETIT_1G102300v2 [Setaria italica]|uniref:Uncharacterized protein n=1 Tax=Setaria italica TaxID=4555 RepID=A0A368PIS3_SETIT|nr:hypothetical protein SETIT_1G102300v2 [Setaria italica]
MGGHARRRSAPGKLHGAARRCAAPQRRAADYRSRERRSAPFLCGSANLPALRAIDTKKTAGLLVCSKILRRRPGAALVRLTNARLRAEVGALGCRLAAA